MKSFLMFCQIFCIAFMQIGCSIYGPENNADFNQINKIQDLEGVYRNLGEQDRRADSLVQVYLSSIIWSGTESLDHKAIDSVEVRALDDTTLVAKAHSGSAIIKSSLFVRGKDFEIHSGKIHIQRGMVPSVAYPPGNPVIGVIYQDINLGLDKDGHGKYRTETAIVGLVFLIPMAVGGHEDIRFVRISK